MWDLHTHILPGFDDGSPDLETSIAMLKLADESGTTHLFATPHFVSGSWLPTWAEITAATESLQQQARQENLSIRLFPGAEVALDWSLLERLPAPGSYCLGGGDHILIEFPLGPLPNYAEEFIFTLQARNFVPVLAHPERCPELKENPQNLARWIAQGVKIQVNAPSLLGHMGRRAQAAARYFLEQGWVDFLGSDAHGMGTRRPVLPRDISLPQPNIDLL